MNSIKWDYWQNVGAARDEYTTAKLALHSMSKRSNGYSRQLEHVDSLRNKFINRSVSFICRESRAERPRMWSAFYLSMLDIVKMLEEMGGVAARNAETIALHYLVDAAAKSGDDKYMWKYVQQFRYDDDEKDSIEEHIFSPAASPAGKRALLARIRLRSEPDIATSLCPPVKTVSTSRLIEAAHRWRHEIAAREADGNTLLETDARTAHALVCCELAGRNHITASDLAELIETMSGQHTFHDLTLNTPHGRQHVTNVEELIDAASPYMTR